MPEEAPTAEVAKTEPPKESVSPPAEQPGAKEGEDTRVTPTERALESRLKEEADKRRTAEEKLQKIEDENTKVREEELKAQGDYKTLLEEQEKQLEALKAENEKHQEADKVEWEGIYNSLSEDQKKVADNFTTLEGLRTYAKSVISMTGLSTDTGLPGSPGGTFGGYASRAEWAEKDLEGFEKAKRGRRPSGVPHMKPIVPKS